MKQIQNSLLYLLYSFVIVYYYKMILYKKYQGCKTVKKYIFLNVLLLFYIILNTFRFADTSMLVKYTLFFTRVTKLLCSFFISFISRS